MPNMNVLIAVGATRVFYLQSLRNLICGSFAIICSMKQRLRSSHWFFWKLFGRCFRRIHTESIARTGKSQKVMANMIAYDDQHQEHIFPVENSQLRVGDLILIKTGEQVPADC